jgi:hypothetical protein
MKRRILKILLYLTITVAICYFILNFKVKPDRVIYMYYNGLSGSCRTYYAQKNLISIDTLRFYNIDTIKNKADFAPKYHLKNENMHDNKEFIVDVPLKILFESKEQIGFPDVIDQGGAFIQFTLFGVTKSINIDPITDNKFYRTLLDSMYEKTALIKADLKNSR